MSPGYMCSSGWHKPTYNPHGMPVVTREYMRESTLLGRAEWDATAFALRQMSRPLSFPSLRASLTSAEVQVCHVWPFLCLLVNCVTVGTANHVDILGNIEVIMDLLRIVCSPPPHLTVDKVIRCCRLDIRLIAFTQVEERILSEIPFIAREIDARLWRLNQRRQAEIENGRRPQ